MFNAAENVTFSPGQIGFLVSEIEAEGVSFGFTVIVTSLEVAVPVGQASEEVTISFTLSPLLNAALE